MPTFYTPKIVLLNFRDDRDDFIAGIAYYFTFFFITYIIITIIIILSRKSFAVIMVKFKISG